MEKEKHIFGKFELELIFHDVNLKKGLMCCTVQNPFKVEKCEATFLGDNKEQIIRKIDRQIKKLRKEFFKEDK